MTYCDNNIRMSKDVHVFKKDNNVALFHALNMSKVYGNDELSQLCDYLKEPKNKSQAEEKFSSDLIKMLISKNVVVDEADSENELLDGIKERIGKFNIRNIVMLVSNNCNLRCSYCQIEENMEQEQMIDMSEEVAEKALNLLKKNSLSTQRKTITITGGEPLLNVDIVRFIIEKVRKEFENTRIVIFTNGSLVTKELADFFKANDILMLVSLDGPKEMHDEVRKNKAGKGSFDDAMNGYNILKEAGCKIGISAVGGTHNIDEIDRTFKFFTDLSPTSIGFNFSHFLIDKDNPTEIPIFDFGKILIDFYEILRDRRIFLENISRPISAFAENTPKVNECQAQGFGFTVDARGKIGPCKSLVVSDVFSEEIDSVDKIEENPMFKDWSMRSPIMVEECRDCSALAICGGGCAYDSYISNKGDYKSIDERVCDYKKYVLEYLIWDLFKRIKEKVVSNAFYSPTIEEQTEAFNSYYDVSNELQRSVGHEHEK